ncbi:MAG: HAMP domain-containing histidine kinase [OCS116 cluster bacterium]|nr:HAMP domain-containing histidine kinase [OCS116 cluster bacterium]
MVSLRNISLQNAIMALSILCLLAGMSSLYFWNKAYDIFDEFYERSYLLGLEIFEARQTADYSQLQKSDVKVSIVKAQEHMRLDNILVLNFEKIDADYKLTELNLSAASTGKSTQIRIYRANRKFKIADIPHGVSRADQFGKLSYRFAQKCDDTILAVQIDADFWALITAETYWACAARPFDWRWLAILNFGIIALILVIVSQNIPKPFIRLARIFEDKLHYFDMQKLKQNGTVETQSIARSIDKFMNYEEQRLDKRIEFFTAMSHDLGSPATRLRLRAELIEDPKLRQKFIKDIDHLTGMIQASLHFMRYEAEKEMPRIVDFGSLIETIVHDYQDMGHNVVYQPPSDISFLNAATLFAKASVKKTYTLHDKRAITGRCQPLNMRRAIENLIDNGLKFGQAVIVGLEADVQNIYINIKDNGGGVRPEELNKLIDAFYQGENVKIQRLEGSLVGTGSVGLGLAIVDSIVAAHEGQLNFTNNAEFGGLEVSLKLPRKLMFEPMVE